MDPQNSSSCKSRLEILQQFESEINFTRRTAFENLIRKYESAPGNSNNAVIDLRSMTVEKGKMRPIAFGKLTTYKGMSSKAKNLLKELQENLLDSSRNNDFLHESQHFMNKLADQSASGSVVRACININETLVMETSSAHGCDLESSIKEPINCNETVKESILMNDTIDSDETSKKSPCRAIGTSTLADQESPSICEITYITSMKRITPVKVTNQIEPSETLESENNLNCPQSGQLVSLNRISIEQDPLSKGVSPGICGRFSDINIGLELRNGKTLTSFIKDGNVVKFSQGHTHENKKLEIKFPEILGNSHKPEDNLSFEFPAKRTVGRNKKTGSKCFSNNIPLSKKCSISKPDQAGEDICILSRHLTRHKYKDSFWNKMSFNATNEAICLSSPQHRVINRKYNETELNKKGKSSISAITSSNRSLMQLRSNPYSTVSVNDSNKEISFLNSQYGTDKEKSYANKLNEIAINNETFGAAMSDDCSTVNSSIHRLKLKHNVSMELEIVCSPLSFDKFKGSKAVANNSDNKAEESSCLTNSHFANSLDEHLDEPTCNEELEPTSDVPENTRYCLRHSTIRRNSEFLLNKNVKKNTSNEAMEFIALSNSAVSPPKDMGKSSTSKKRLEYSPIATSSCDCLVEKNNGNGSLVVSNTTLPHESDFKSPGICHRFTKMSLMHKLGNSPKTISSKVANQIDAVEKFGINDPENIPGHSSFFSQPRNRNDPRKRKADFEFNSMTNKYFIQESTIQAISPNTCMTQQNYILHKRLPLPEKANKMFQSPQMHKILKTKLSHVTPVRKILSSKSNHVRRRIASITACSSEMSGNNDVLNDRIKKHPVDILPNVSTHHLIESHVRKVSEVKTKHARKPFEFITVSSEDTSDHDDFSNDSMGSCSTDVSTNIGNRHLIESPACITYRPKSCHKKYSSQKSVNGKTLSSDVKKNSHVVHCSDCDQTEKTLLSKCIENRETSNFQSPKAECNNAMKTSISRKKLNFCSPKIFEGSFLTLSPKVQLK